MTWFGASLHAQGYARYSRSLIPDCWSLPLPRSCQLPSLLDRLPAPRSAGLARVRPLGFVVLLSWIVIPRLAISVLLATTLLVAAMPVSPRACILSNVASAKPCKAGCCANKTCCETSEKNTSTPSQSLVKTDAGQQLNAVCFTAVAMPLPAYEPTAKQSRFGLAAIIADPSARLAVLCTLLI